MGYISFDHKHGYYVTQTLFETTASCDSVNPEVEREEKQQRAKVQHKKHKAKTFHIEKKPDVPKVLKQFVNKSSAVRDQATREFSAFFDLRPYNR